MIVESVEPGCLFVHKVPFMLQEPVKTTKTDKTRFFLARKR